MKAPGQRTSGFHISDILDMPEGRGAGGGVGGAEGAAPPPPPSSSSAPHLTPYSDRPLTLHAPWQLHPDHHGKYYLGTNFIKALLIIVRLSCVCRNCWNLNKSIFIKTTQVRIRFTCNKGLYLVLFCWFWKEYKKLMIWSVWVMSVKYGIVWYQLKLSIMQRVNTRKLYLNSWRKHYIR